MTDSTTATSKPKQSFADLLAASGSKIPSIKRGQELQGKVVAVSKDEVLVDIGAKSEGIVTGRELDSVRELAASLSVGDTIDVSVMHPENDAGQIVLSLRKLSGEKRWAELEEKRDNDEDINVAALEVNRGGVICDYVGLRGFLPASQLLKVPSKLTDLIGKTLSVRVIEVDRATNRLIFTQKVHDKKNLAAISKLLEKVEVGQELSGVISAVLPFGIFVEVRFEETKVTKEPFDETQGKPKEPKEEKTSGSSGSSVTSATTSDVKLEGLVHISELAWEKVEDPATVYKVGDEVTVLVIAKDEESGRLNLSIKQLGEDPFLEAAGSYVKDTTVSGEVVRVTPYGVYVTLENGVEGLMHISKIPPNSTYDIGQTVECTVEGVDNRARHITLLPIITEKPILYR